MRKLIQSLKPVQGQKGFIQSLLVIVFAITLLYLVMAFLPSINSSTVDGAIQFLYEHGYYVLAANGLNADRMVITDGSGRLTDDADFRVTAGDTLNITKIITSQLTDSGLTAGRVPYAGAGGLVSDEAGFEYNAGTNTLSVPNLSAPTGRGATCVIAANDSPAIWKAQADKVLGAAEDIGAYINAQQALGVNSFKIAAGNPYWASSIVVSVSSLYIEGTGSGGHTVSGITTLTLANGSNCHGFSSVADVTQRYLFISNMILDGNKTNQVGNWDCINSNGYLAIGAWTQTGIQNVVIREWTQDGINVTAGGAWRVGADIDGLIIDSCGRNGITDTFDNELTIRNCWIISCTSNGATLGGSNHNLEIYAEGNGGYGIYFVAITESRINLMTMTNVRAGLASEWSNDIVGDVQAYGNATGAGGDPNDKCDIYLNDGYNYSLNLQISYALSVAGKDGLVLNNIRTSTFTGVISGNRYAVNVTGIATCANVLIHNSVFQSGTANTNFNAANAGNITFTNNRGYIDKGEIRTVYKAITAGVQNTVTSIQNTFGADVWIIDANVNISAAASATNPTYDMGTDDDGAGAPSVANNLFDAIPDTVDVYNTKSNGLGGDVSGKWVKPVLWQSAAAGNDWVNFIITDAAGADTAGTIYITVMGK